MRLLICTQDVDSGSQLLAFFLRWIEEFAKHCEQVTVICLKEGKHSLPQNVAVLSLGKERGSSKLTRIIRFFKYIIARRNEYDAVFVHMNPEYVILGGLLWRLMGKRVVLWHEHKQTNWRLRLAVLFAHRILAASAHGVRVSTRKLLVTGHGIDTEKAPPPRATQSGTLWLMTIGRISPIKHLEVVIDAFLELKKTYPSTLLSVLGAPASDTDVAYVQKLRTQLVEAGEDPAAILLGSVPHHETPHYRARANYFLHASDTGSMDKSVLDAIMSGVLPISSSEAYESLFKGYTHLLMYPKGDATTLAKQVRALEALEEDERENIRRVLKERVVREHGLSALIPRILEILTPAP